MTIYRGEDMIGDNGYGMEKHINVKAIMRHIWRDAAPPNSETPWKKTLRW